MILSHFVLGLISVLWGAGMVYWAKAEKVPWIVKPFMFADWIKSERINRFIATVMGYASIISGLLFLLGGLFGRKVWPFP